MYQNPHRCVVDSQGNYIEFVIMRDPCGKWRDQPCGYKMKDGETLIEAPSPSNILKPRWIGSEWREMATPEEIEAAKPEPLPTLPSIEERLAATEALLLDMIMGGDA